MALTNTHERYGRVAQVFHWITAVLILALIPLGVYMHELPLATPDQLANKVWFYSLHKTLGVVVFAVAIARIVWAIANPHPKPLHPERRAETFAAATVHWLLYAGIVLAPLTGLAHHAATEGFAPIWWPFGQNIPFIPKDETLAIILGYMHFGTAAMIAISVLAHIAGALKHHFLDQDKTLVRMVSGDTTSITLPVDSASGFRGMTGMAAIITVALSLGVTAAYGWAVANPSRASLDLTSDRVDTQTPSSWSVMADESTLGIEIVQLGSPVSGAFANWSADIVFDPDDLDKASVEVRIDMASLSIGSVSQQAVGPEFLDADSFPEARFVANEFVQLDDGRYEARGSLTIRDVTTDFILPFALAIDGDTAKMTANVELNRMDFGVGAQGYSNEDSVGFAVAVNVDLTATRASAQAN